MLAPNSGINNPLLGGNIENMPPQEALNASAIPAVSRVVNKAATAPPRSHSESQNTNIRTSNGKKVLPPPSTPKRGKSPIGNICISCLIFDVIAYLQVEVLLQYLVPLVAYPQNQQISAKVLITLRILMHPCKDWNRRKRKPRD